MCPNRREPGRVKGARHDRPRDQDPMGFPTRRFAVRSNVRKISLLSEEPQRPGVGAPTGPLSGAAAATVATGAEGEFAAGRQKTAPPDTCSEKKARLRKGRDFEFGIAHRAGLGTSPHEWIITGSKLCSNDKDGCGVKRSLNSLNVCSCIVPHLSSPKRGKNVAI
jgi:hypothetical protein